jgi:hypothetical protein
MQRTEWNEWAPASLTISTSKTIEMKVTVQASKINTE